MPYTSRKPPPPEIWGDEKLMALFQWMEGELDAIAQDSQETIALELRETQQAPAKPREGMVVRADGTGWNPGSGKGLYTYKSSAWVKVNEGTVDKYSSISDGSTTAAASGADTVKFRANSGLTVAVGSNDVTHGDNVLYSIDLSGFTAETAIATGDYVVLRDVSAGANVKMLVTDFLKIINGLTEDTSPDRAADFALVYDTSASAAKKVLLQNLGGMVLIDSGSFAAGASKEWTGLSAYRLLRLCVFGARPATDGVYAALGFSADGGSTYTAPNITSGAYLVNSAGSGDADANNLLGDNFALNKSNNNLVGNAAGEGIWSDLEICGFNQAANMIMHAFSHWVTTDGTDQAGWTVGRDEASTAYDTLKLFFSSGNISANGTYALWGIKG